MNLKPYDCLHCKTRDCSILSKCKSDVLQSLSNYKTKGILKKGEHLFNEGERIKGVYFVKRGVLKVQIDSSKGKPIILRIVGRGSILGNRINISDKASSHSHSAVASSEVEYCYVPNSIFEKIIAKSTSLKQDMIDQFMDELHQTESKISRLARNTVRENLADALLMLSDIYCNDKDDNSFEICFHRQDIADLIGTTKQQVSKNLKDFEKEGIIKISAKKFHFIDIETLRLISN